MNRFAVMVDAGYLLRQGIEIISHRESSSRADLDIENPGRLIDVLLDKAHAVLNLNNKELLRVYWYDGVLTHGLTHQQRAFAHADDVQFRSGTVNGRGQQKSVDSLIVTDLIELSTHRAVCDVVLLTGDSDLSVGIEMAQKHGVRIAVVGVEDLDIGVAHHQSFEITSRADRVGMLRQADLLPVLRYAPVSQAGQSTPQHKGQSHSAPHYPFDGSGGQGTAPSSPARTHRALDEKGIEFAVLEFIAKHPGPLSEAVDPETKRIDMEIDRALLHHVFAQLGHGRLTEAEKICARQVFRAEV